MKKRTVLVLTAAILTIIQASSAFAHGSQCKNKAKDALAQSNIICIHVDS
ncbi:MAG: hypothetical protein ABR592_05530 [Nitriliruptorales bacterium]